MRLGLKVVEKRLSNFACAFYHYITVGIRCCPIVKQMGYLCYRKVTSNYQILRAVATMEHAK